MTKLFIATGIFHPESGGPATYLYHLLPHLQNAGFEIRLLTYSDFPSDKDKETYPYPVTRIPRKSLPIRVGQYAAAARPIMQWADLIYVHTLALPLGLASIFNKPTPKVLKIVGDQAWERAIRNQWIPATTDIDDFQSTPANHPLARFGQIMRSREVKHMDGVIVPSEYLKRMVVGWGASPDKVNVVYNALPPQQDILHISKSEAREQLGLDGNRAILLTVARLTPWKGVDAIIRALDAIPDAQLLIAGDGTIRPDLESLTEKIGMKNRVTFLGRVAHADVAKYMRAADYTVLYSGYEGLSHTLLESLRVGTPVIASDKGGNPEVVIHDVNGLLVSYKSVEALRESFRFALTPETIAHLASGTQANADRFNYNRMIKETITVLNSLE